MFFLLIVVGPSLLAKHLSRTQEGRLLSKRLEPRLDRLPAHFSSICITLLHTMPNLDFFGTTTASYKLALFVISLISRAQGKVTRL